MKKVLITSGPRFVFQQSEIEQIEKSERVGGAQQHKRVTAALNKQIQQQTSRIEEVCMGLRAREWAGHSNIRELQQRSIKKYNNKLQELKRFVWVSERESGRGTAT